MGVAASSSSSSSSSSSKKHEVFLSFRGEDTRRTFTSHLHNALCLKGIETYIDDRIPKGDDISQSLIQAIKDSSIAVVIFSENYASSKWCLNELLQILLCKQQQGQHVLPIFYKVDPSHVRHQRGSYEKAFAKHLARNPEKVEQWRKALSETANLSGFHFLNYRDEAKVIQNIVNDISQKLNHWSPSMFRDIVGIDENSNDIELLLERFSTIGIWGMGGIGKTTMAKVVFAKFRSQFDRCCFLENFNETLEKQGLNYIHDKLSRELLKDTYHDGVFGRLSHLKVLIVLDDVSNTRLLDDLRREASELGYGSKVIITSRDRQVLHSVRVDGIHEAKALGHDSSLKLFNLKAFREDGYKSEYEEVVERAVSYGKGIPLALTILGSFLYSRTVDEWESALRKIERTSNQHIQAVLKLSFDGLDDEEKEIFLDIAYFFKGESWESVKGMLESFGFNASICLRTLKDKALIHGDYSIQMYDLIQSMAFEIVCQECKDNPGGRSRLQNPYEICDVLKHNRGTEAIQGISLDLSQIGNLQLSADVDTFGKMTNLRFLKLYTSYPLNERSCFINLPSGLESFSRSLRYLRWDNFPSESLPLSLCAEKIVELHMPESRLTKLWDGVQNLVELRKIDFSGSQQLIELPDFSTAQKLESIKLQNCVSLCNIHPSILSLPRLSDVDLLWCRNLKSLKSMSPSKSLPHLDAYGCNSLEEFSFSSDKLTYLCLWDARVKILDFSMGHMGKLHTLYLNCSRLKSLPINDICCMTSLEELHLSDCGETIDKSKLLSLFDSLKSLTNIGLDRTCKLTELPNNIKHLSRLRSLSVCHCKNLQSLPELPPSIQYLDASNCTSLKTLQLTCRIGSSLLADETMLGSTLCSSIGYLTNLRELNHHGCQQLCELPDCIKHLSSLRSLSISDCKDLQSLPELPPSIKKLDASNCTSLKTLQLTSHIESSLLADGTMLGSTLCSSVSYLTNLRELNLHGCQQLCELPEFINSSSLQHINLTDCRRLRSLPELPPSIETIAAGGCLSLVEIVPNLITSAPQLRYLSLGDCLTLEHRSLSHVTECAYFSLKQLVYTEQSGSVHYPGRKVPEWITFTSNKGTEPFNFITIELPSNTTDLIGFIFCSVLSHRPHSSLQCQLYYDGEEYKCSDFDANMNGSYYFELREELDSHHVSLWCTPVKFRNFNKTMDDQSTNYKPKVSFEFSVYTYSEKLVNGVIEACGVCPIYASEYRDFVEEMELKKSNLALGTQKDTCHDDADVNSFHGILQYARFSLNQQKCGNFEGSIIPDWFTCKSAIEDETLQVSVQLASDFDNLKGFIFCFVMPSFSSRERDPYHWSWKYSSDSFMASSGGPRSWHYLMEKLNSNDVFLLYDPLHHGRMLHDLRSWEHEKDELTFRFKFGNGLIKECGVRPIYVSEYTNFLEQKSTLKVSTGRKRHQNTDDDQHQLPSTEKLKESSTIQFIPLNSESKTSLNVEEFDFCSTSLEKCLHYLANSMLRCKWW